MWQGQGSGLEVAHGGVGKKEAGQKSTELGTRGRQEEGRVLQRSAWKAGSKLGMVVYTCNPSMQEAEAEGLPRFKVSLGYSVRPCLKGGKES